MLVALNKNNSRTEADNSIKKETYFCPVCKGVVTPKQGKIKIWHYAHEYLGNCYWENESKEHMVAKKTIRDIFLGSGSYKNCELEFPTGDNIVDVLVTDTTCKNFAIEIQASNISMEKFHLRFTNLSNAGLPVLWVLTGPLLDKFKEIHEVDIRTTRLIYELHGKFYYGRFYGLIDGEVYAIYPHYRTKTLIATLDLVRINNFQLVESNKGEMRVARFYDRYAKGGENEKST